MTYERIYVPLDRSVFARHAAMMAARLGRAFDAHVVGSFVDTTGHSEQRLSRLFNNLPAECRANEQLSYARPPARFDVGAVVDSLAEVAGRPVERRRLSGSPFGALAQDIERSGSDLVVLGARGEGGAVLLGSVCERLARHTAADMLVVKDDDPAVPHPGKILVCIDGSQQAYAGLITALELAAKFDRQVEAVAAYDPFLHYTLFHSISGVLSEKASQVFKFKEQEKLHEDIIDIGLAKIYQAHLEVARRIAAERGMELSIKLLAGKAQQKILQHAEQTKPWLMSLGRTGVHSTGLSPSSDTMDIGSTAENMMRLAPCNILLTSRGYRPALEVQAEESMEWTAEARQQLMRAPSFVRGMATSAILRWAMERGHSVITPNIVAQAMEDLLPQGAAKSMGIVASRKAGTTAKFADGKTYVCPECTHVVRGFRPASCVVCSAAGSRFSTLDGDAPTGEAATVEETFDGVTLRWTEPAKLQLEQLPDDNQRRRVRARIEKTAKLRRLTTIDAPFAAEMSQLEVGDGTTASESGPDDAVYRPRHGSTFGWTDAAWARLCCVPEGFMRDMARGKIEKHAEGQQRSEIDFALCEQGIMEGRRMMAEMLGGSDS